MKALIIIASFLAFSILTQAQSKETIIQYLDKDKNALRNKDEAFFYRTREDVGGKIILRDYYKSGQLQLMAECSAVTPLIVFDGEVKYYYDNGLLVAEGAYSNNVRVGLHKTYYGNGKPETEIVYEANNMIYKHYWTENGDDVLADGHAVFHTGTNSGHHQYMEIENNQHSASFEVEIASGDTLYTMTEPMPEYKDGFDAMMMKISRSLRYPPNARRKGVEGTILIQFMVTKDGDVKDSKVLGGIDPECNAEGIRVVKMLTGWKPGMHKNKPVNTRFVLPIKFKLD